MGVTNAADVLLTGRIVLAEEMGAMGFFNKVLPRADFDRHVDEYAHLMAAASPESVTTAKRQMWADVIGHAHRRTLSPPVSSRLHRPV